MRLTLGELFVLIETQKINRYLPRRWENLSVEGKPYIERAQTVVVVLASPRRGEDFADGSAQDFVTFRDPAWSALTFAQIGSSSADLLTSLDNLHSCPNCIETGVSRFFVGERPDAHKYIIGGAVEIGLEAVAAHYLRNHGPKQKFYWKLLWALPQTFSLADHAYAAGHNASLVLK